MRALGAAVWIVVVAGGLFSLVYLPVALRDVWRRARRTWDRSLADLPDTIGRHPSTWRQQIR